MALTQERLKELLKYDPETGLFYWLVDRYRVKRGDRAGSVSPRHRYRIIRLDQRNYAEHRLAWFYMNGEWPPAEIDHADLDRQNNRWSNLRSATSSQNKANRQSRGAYPKGVCFHKASGLFSSRVHSGGKQISLGYFKTPELAHQAYCDAAPKYHGKFARAA
jgi:hypothetical protein